MSVNIDAREVLTYLNELGYCDITPRQLKEFIRDLKVLIKYDQKRARIQNQENINPVSSGEYYYSNAELYENTPDYEDDVDHVAEQINQRDEKYLSEVFDYLHSATTYSSRAKNECKTKSGKNPKKDQTVISVEILKPRPIKPFVSSGSSNSYKPNENKPSRPLSSCFTSTSTANKVQYGRTKSAATFSSGYDRNTNNSAVKIVRVKSKLNKAKTSASAPQVSNRIYGKEPFKTPSRPNSPARSRSSGSVSDPVYLPYPHSFTRPKQVYSEPNPLSRKSGVPKSTDASIGTELKPTTAFIRPRKPLKISKSDPVALYQQYQTEWKKQKLPGEDKRYDLRWAIRERMLGEPDIIQIATDKASRKVSKDS